MANPPSYAAILRDAERARFGLDEVTAGLVDLDFDRPFLPKTLTHSERLGFLDDRERVVLGQIRGHTYAALNVMAERFIVPFVMSQASRCLHGDVERFLALMGFGQLAAKHMALFERFADACERGFDAELEIIGPAEDIIARFLTHDTLAIGLLVLHFECVAQPHYVRGARDCSEMDAQFKLLLNAHWREEAHNARILVLILAELTKQVPQHTRERAVEQYVDMLDDLADVFGSQIELDLAAFERVARPLTESQREAWRREQSRSYNEVFLGYGIEHRVVRRTLSAHFGGPFPSLDEVAGRFPVSANESARQGTP